MSPSPYSPSPQCDSYRPGHNVHPIQFFRGHPTPGRPVHLTSVVERDDGALVAVVRVDGGPGETWLFHDLPPVRAALGGWQHSGAFLHAHDLLIVGDPDDATPPCLHPCRAPETWTECATLASVGSADPATLLNTLGGLLLRPTKPATP